MSERITGQKLRSPHNVDASASTASLAGVGHGPGGWSVLSGFATLHRWSWAVTVARIMHGTVIGVYFILWCDVRCTRTNMFWPDDPTSELIIAFQFVPVRVRQDLCGSYAF